MSQHEQRTGSIYVNIGTSRSCLFVEMSLRLLNVLEQNPVLHLAVEEALQCAKLGYHNIGVLVFAQLLNALNRPTPEERHEVAHKLLRRGQTKETFDRIVAAFKTAAAEESLHERTTQPSLEEHARKVHCKWKALIRSYTRTESS